MKIAVERYFGAIGHLLDETNYILTDWSTPMDKLVEQCDIRIYQRGFELGHECYDECQLMIRYN